MEKTLITRRQAMNLCKAVFNFKEFGITPRLKDISLYSGWWFLSYYFFGSEKEDIEYKIKFCVSKQCMSVTLYEVIGINKLKQVGRACFAYGLDLEKSLACIYHSGFNFLHYDEKPWF